ncbi:MAG TPA: hypothetical protein PKA27_09395 [Fimbriimonadaceae bacterium]|nr:hypothetical protein [Fimbriimonadaceae bacterium]
MNTLNTVRKGLYVTAITLAAGLFFVNVYNSMIDAPNWGHNLPSSIEATRAYYSVANPGNFFRIFAPLTQFILLLGLILTWRIGGRTRLLAAAALLLAVGADMLTFGFFYPRNEIMFVRPITDVDAVRSAWAQWSNVNWLRSSLILVDLGFAFATLIALVRREEQVTATATSRQELQPLVV